MHPHSVTRRSSLCTPCGKDSLLDFGEQKTAVNTAKRRVSSRDGEIVTNPHQPYSSCAVATSHRRWLRRQFCCSSLQLWFQMFSLRTPVFKLLAFCHTWRFPPEARKCRRLQEFMGGPAFVGFSKPRILALYRFGKVCLCGGEKSRR